MRQMNKRIQILGEENDRLRENVEQLKQKTKENIIKNIGKTDGQNEGETDEMKKCKKCVFREKLKGEKKNVMVSVDERQLQIELRPQLEE